MRFNGVWTRWRGRTIGFSVAGVLLAVSAIGHSSVPEPAYIELYMDGVAVTSLGLLQVPAGHEQEYLEHSRVPVHSDDLSTDLKQDHSDLATESAAWLAQGAIPGAGTQYEDLARTALLDIRALIHEDGALAAGAHKRWRYAWPRDNSFAAVALARTGHSEDAISLLEFLASVQGKDGSFQARYLLDGSGTPDNRPPQTDGTGWVLWALGDVITQMNTRVPGSGTAELADHTVMLDRSTDRILELIDNPRSLPPVSPDYWEVRETALTLGTAGPLLAGLESAANLYALLGQSDSSMRVQEGATRLNAAITKEFGAVNYSRHITGGLACASTSFVQPPFVETALEGAHDAWVDSVKFMARPAGGLAPGGSWKADGISWTPETALYAMTAAASGDREGAERWLTWIDEHRTMSGAIPEKVLADGSPAAVAPLAWSAANILIALDDLEKIAAN